MEPKVIAWVIRTGGVVRLQANDVLNQGFDDAGNPRPPAGCWRGIGRVMPEPDKNPVTVEIDFIKLE